jgi:hypothetical protein
MKSPLLIFLAAAPLAAGPLVPSQVPASAKWMLHADLDAMRGSATGKHVFARIEDEHGAQLRAMKRMFSVHPLEDLRGITLYGDGQPGRGVALIHGNFDPAHLEDVVRAADDHAESQHAGHVVHSWKDQGRLQHAAFANDRLLVFSRQQDLLESALDLLQAKTPAAAEPFFAEAGGNPLLAASASLAAIDMPADAARLVRMARTLRLAANEHDGRFSLRVQAETADGKDADKLRRMLDGVIAFAQVSDAKFDGLDLQSQLTTPGNPPSLAAAVSLPVAEWITLMERAEAENARKDER